MENIRYIARFILEAKTPLFVGSGEASLLTDALVQKDCNGLPMMPGSSLAGVLRHSFQVSKEKEDKWNNIFGFQDGRKGEGSRLRVSNAYMMLNENAMAEGMLEEVPANIHEKYSKLPKRQHVRINHKGVAEQNGLFDNEVVYAGTRFKFEIELVGSEVLKDIWLEMLQAIHQSTFRLGSGTRNGYGNLAVLDAKQKVFDLTNETDFNKYLNLDPSLNGDFKADTFQKSNTNQNLTYTLNLKPDSFFIFSEGSGDDKADNKPKEEEVAVYEENKIDFKNKTLIPASSIKGALAHRTAFQYNKIKGRFIDQLADTMGGVDNVFKLFTGTNNTAVAELFGMGGGETQKVNGDDTTVGLSRGHVILDDQYIISNNDKIFNHVAIDRFTGGAMDGALFSEKVSQTNGLILNIVLDTDKFTNNQVLEAFEEALKDVCDGLLPLGGMTTKGHGIFTGNLLKGTEIKHTYGDARN